MSHRRLFCLLLSLCLLCAPMAVAETTMGTMLTAPASFDFTMILPSDMADYGSSQDFQYGYRNSYMLVGASLSAEPTFDAFYDNRIGRDFATESVETVNGFEARRYTPKQTTNVYAIYAVRTGAEAGLVEIAFYPADASAKNKNEACIRQVMGSVRSRSQTLEQDFAADWTETYANALSGLSLKLPDSMIALAQPTYSDTEAEFRNDYVEVLVFVYDVKLDEYIERYDMNDTDFHVTHQTVNGVNVHVFVPVSEQISSDCAYVVAEGDNGMLLEMIFGPTDASEKEQNDRYVQGMIEGISR